MLKMLFLDSWLRIAFFKWENAQFETYIKASSRPQEHPLSAPLSPQNPNSSPQLALVDTLQVPPQTGEIPLLASDLNKTCF